MPANSLSSAAAGAGRSRWARGWCGAAAGNSDGLPAVLPGEAVWPVLQCLSQKGRAGIRPGMVPARFCGASGAAASRRHGGVRADERMAAGMELSWPSGAVFYRRIGWGSGFGCAPVPLWLFGPIGSRNAGGDDRLPVKGGHGD